MFSAKNYGLPKDLIEAAKRVHEKQLEENLDKRIKKPKNKYPDFTKLSDALTPAFKKIKKQREEDLKAEEVQFTEEELAEAFTIFLEENYYVGELTEEDLDYVFENEFPQWLEEGLGKAIGRGFKFYKDFYRKNPGKALTAGGLGVGASVLRNRSSNKQKKPEVKKALHDLADRENKVMNKKLPGAKKPQAEEVQFTEEELAEAFAIFLEENFYVEMLTEEDLDYVFEEEFPHWLEEQRRILSGDEFQRFTKQRRKQDKELATMGLKRDGSSFKPTSNRSSSMSDNARRVMNQQRIKRVEKVKAAETGKAKGSARDLPQYLPNRSKIFQGDTEGGNTQAPKSTPDPKSTPKSTPASKATPASTARNQVRRPSSTGTKSSVYKPQSRIMKDTGAAAPDFGNNNATFDAENKPVFKSDTETRRAANLRTISKRKRQAPTRRASTRRSPTRQSTGLPSWAKKAFTSEN